MTKKPTQKPRKPKAPPLNKRYANQIKDLMREGYLPKNERFMQKVFK